MSDQRVKNSDPSPDGAAEPQRTIGVVLNPAAAYGRARRVGAHTQRLLREAGFDFEWKASLHPGHARILASELAQRHAVVLAIGGDGTVQEVASGIVASGAAAALAVIPAGTGNDFASAIDWPRKPAEVVRRLPSARVTHLDYGQARWTNVLGHDSLVTFFNSVGAGFDAATADAARGTKILPGSILAYLVAVFATLRSWKSPEITVSFWDAEGSPVGPLRGELFLMAVSNGKRIGGGFYLTPQADMGDGLLDLCLARDVRTGRVLKILPRAMLGGRGLEDEPELLMARVTKVWLRSSEPIPLHADGEVLAKDVMEIEAEVYPAGLAILQR